MEPEEYSGTSTERDLQNAIGQVWGKFYGKLSTAEAASLKKVQREYDASVFHVDGQAITEKISSQREKMVVEEYWGKTRELYYPWDSKIFLFAKDLDLKMDGDTILYLAREIYKTSFPIEVGPELQSDRKEMLNRVGGHLKGGTSSTKTGAIGLRNLIQAHFPTIELIRFFRDLLDLGKSTAEVAYLLLNPILADKLLRKRYCNRPPYIDSDGIQHKQPDQPLVGRFNEKKDISYFIGESVPLFQGRIAHIYIYSAYFQFLKLNWVTDEAKSWIKERLELLYWIKQPLDKYRIEFELAQNINNLKIYYDVLISDIKKNFYGRRDFKGYADATQRFIHNFYATPNIVFSLDSLRNRIAENIKNSAFIYFNANFKMLYKDIEEIFNAASQDYISQFEDSWNLENYENTYKFAWSFWNDQRSRYMAKRKKELAVEWEFAAEQRSAIESLDTLQKKHFSKINRILTISSPKTGYDSLDRALIVIALELSEIGLSGPYVTRSDQQTFQKAMLKQLSDEAKFLVSSIALPEITKRDNSDSSNVILDTLIEEEVGPQIAKFFQDSFGVYRDIFKTRDKFTREIEITLTEKYYTIIELFDRFIRNGIELLPLFDRSEHLDVLDSLHRLNALEFAKFIVLASSVILSLEEAYNKAVEYFETETVNLDGQAKYYDVLVFLKLLEDVLASDTSKDQEHVAISQLVSQYTTSDYSNQLTMKDCEQIIRKYLDEKSIRHTQPYIQSFRDKTYEWNVVRKVPQAQFIGWLAGIDLSEKSVAGQTLPGSKMPEQIVTIVYQDLTGERKYIGEDSQHALDAGLFQAIRPGEIIRSFGIQLKSIEFAITDPKFPGWVWLNQNTLVGSEAQKRNIIESTSVFSKKNPIFAILMRYMD